MAKVKVYVYETGDILVKYRVYPAVVLLNTNDKLEVLNTTNGEAKCFVPAKVLDNGDVILTIAKHSRGSKDAKRQGPLASSYEVFVDGEKAHAQSDPVIIIDG